MSIVQYSSRLADIYSKSRPTYPDELFSFLASKTPDNRYALDCGTGNGQAAISLSKRFSQVIASDMSIDQLKNARVFKNVNYVIAKAENFPIREKSIDLITVAQALHWFNLTDFYPEVIRVLKPRGIIAVWAYHVFHTNPKIDNIIFGYYQLLEPYWSSKIKLIEEKYKTIPFPFEEIIHPSFEMIVSWSLYELLDFLSSWSATSKFLSEKGYSPIQEIREELLGVWGSPNRRRLFKGPLYLRVGKL